MSLVYAQVNKVDSRGEYTNSYVIDHASCMPNTYEAVKCNLPAEAKWMHKLIKQKWGKENVTEHASCV